MWIDFNGQPLKWYNNYHLYFLKPFNNVLVLTCLFTHCFFCRHYPIGVLCDLHTPEISLPWCVTIHFDKFPESELLHCPSR